MALNLGKLHSREASCPVDPKMIAEAAAPALKGWSGAMGEVEYIHERRGYGVNQDKITRDKYPGTLISYHKGKSAINILVRHEESKRDPEYNNPEFIDVRLLKLLAEMEEMGFIITSTLRVVSFSYEWHQKQDDMRIAAWFCSYGKSYCAVCRRELSKVMIWEPPQVRTNPVNPEGQFRYSIMRKRASSKGFISNSAKMRGTKAAILKDLEAAESIASGRADLPVATEFTGKEFERNQHGWMCRKSELCSAHVQAIGQLLPDRTFMLSAENPEAENVWFILEAFTYESSEYTSTMVRVAFDGERYFEVSGSTKLQIAPIGRLDGLTINDRNLLKVTCEDYLGTQ